MLQVINSNAGEVDELALAGGGNGRGGGHHQALQQEEQEGGEVKWVLLDTL
jgi:hypothetical protein